MYQSIEEEAWGLVHSLASESSSSNGLGTMTPTVYDTAWVAMTEKKFENGKSRPLFPEAYSYLEQTQSKDGSWGADSSSTDGIVNTLAALLALKKRECRQADELQATQTRCRAAKQALSRLLEGWDLDSSDRVGMELLIPNLLRLLEDEGIDFSFGSRKALMALNAAKLGRLRPAIVSPEQTTFIHTLEAFVGTLDFDGVKQHKMPNGSMLASPASTAAYLMNATDWDEEAEAYLRMVFQRQSEMGHKGGFPSAFPTTNFEISWVLATLLECGFSKDDFLMADLRSLSTVLETDLKQSKGVVGWAPSCLPDADDTAKTISTLALMGWQKEVEPMIQSFETDAHFITYRGERNASVSTNCNVLTCLLQTADPALYTKQIVKCATFITKIWFDKGGTDKWHTSIQYSGMLTAQALLLLLKRWAKLDMVTENIPHKLMSHDIPRTLLGILAQTMSSQNSDGSWESKLELTAYAVLTLAALLSLPWFDFLKFEGIACMLRGKAYLEENRLQWRVAERLWVEKTVYGSPNLSQAYCLAASKVGVPPSLVSKKICDIFPSTTKKKITKLEDFFSQVPAFSSCPTWKLQLSLLQCAIYTTALKDHRYDVFPPTGSSSNEKYQDYIPFTWIGCKDVLSAPVIPRTLWDMMLVSMFNFQVDAFMETVVRKCYNGRLDELKAMISSLFDDHLKQEATCNGDDNQSATLPTSQTNGKRLATTNSLNRKELNGTQDSVTRAPHNSTTNGNGLMNGKAEPNGSSQPDRDGGTNVGCTTNGHGATNVTDTHDLSKRFKDRGETVKPILTRFINFSMQHPKVLASPAPIRRWLAHELLAFLLAHVTHMEDCDGLARASVAHGHITWTKPRTTFFNWVRTTSADHTSCPYSFVFYLCLVGEGRGSLSFNMQQLYALEDACRHLAAMCRQYNDLGSVLRDKEERNLNSINFPEFVVDDKDTAATEEELVGRKKRDLLAVAEYERRCLDRVLGELELIMDCKTMEKLRLLVQVTDLYGQIYVVSDIGIRQDNRQCHSGGEAIKAL